MIRKVGGLQLAVPAYDRSGAPGAHLSASPAAPAAASSPRTSQDRTGKSLRASTANIVSTNENKRPCREVDRGGRRTTQAGAVISNRTESRGSRCMRVDKIGHRWRNGPTVGKIGWTQTRIGITQGGCIGTANPTQSQRDCRDGKGDLHLYQKKHQNRITTHPTKIPRIYILEA